MAIYAASKIQIYHNTNVRSKYSQYNPALAEKYIKKDIEKFLQKYSKEINNNKFDHIYKNVFVEFQEDAKIILPELRKLFHKCKINDLEFMDYLPPYYIYGDQHILKFEIPANIRQINNEALIGVPNLNHIIWKTKLHNSNSFPSFYDIYHATKALSSQFKNLTIEFPEMNYDKGWIKQLKEFLKVRCKAKQEDLKPLRIKFIDKEKDIKIA